MPPISLDKKLVKQKLTKAKQRVRSRIRTERVGFRGMEHSVIATLIQCRPELLSEWRRRLRNEPVVSPLALPVTLDHLMVRTLDDLAIFLGRRTVAKSAKPLSPSADDAPWPPPCRCGLNPFLAYYTCGEQAIEGVLANPVNATSSAMIEQVRKAWRTIASEELEGFCGVCRLTSAAKETSVCQASPKQTLVPRRRLAKQGSGKKIPA